jgi:2-succinyl-5-enolpyruvyl-6-hydroxy-3-cyclohexene-1-carboxylate synthase
VTDSPAQQFAASLLAQLVAHGVDHIFLAPGARSQSLAIAAGQLADAGHVQLHVRLDERSLAFQALGVGLVSGFPAVVITTSGTAVANLHPAVLEAHHAGIPMILLTADRPAELRGVGANQTTNQLGIFADAVRSCVDVPTPTESDSAEALNGRAAELAISAITQSVEETGPVQLNLGFREPLSGTSPNAAEIFNAVAAQQLEDEMTGSLALVQDAADAANLADCTDENCGHDHSAEIVAASERQPDSVIDLNLKTVVVAGDAGYLARWYCTGLPLLAEPSSGVRHLPESIQGYLWVLREDEVLVDQVQQVLVFGKPTLSRQVQALLKKPGVRVFSDPGRHGVFNPAHNAHVLGDDVEFLGEPDPAWIAAWRDSAKQLVASKPDNLKKGALSRRSLVEAVWKGAGKRNPLLLGASRLIREADYWAPNKERLVFANRGLAGIDGTVATATGIALTHPGFKVRVLLGDLTLLHDAGSLAVDDRDGRLNIQLIVGNDHGGTIFEGLEVAKNLGPAEFERLFKTPQQVDLPQLAAAYGWQHVKVTDAEQLRAVMKLEGRVLIEVPLV